VHLSDPQIGRDPVDAQAFRAVVKRVNALRPAPRFVVMTGDLTDHNAPDDEVEEFQAIRRELLAPSYLVPGNHDVSFDPSPTTLRRYRRIFGETPYRFDEGPVSFIGLDAQLYNARRRTDRADRAAAKQWRTLVKLVKSASSDGQRIVILMHIPSVPSFFHNRVKRHWQPEWLVRYRALVRKYGVEAELAGHTHKDETYVVGTTRILIAPPISRKYEREPSFRVFRVTQTGLWMRQIYLSDRLKARNYELDVVGLDRARYARWWEEMTTPQLVEMWERRYAGDPPPTLKRKLGRRYRSFHLRPYSFQPKDGLEDRF
jgi:3',5'-cyclic AMP phosphodiesterase CpdA